MKQGYGMQLEQSQRLRMTPELVQAIGLLQLNTQELATYIEEQLLVNPVLESDWSQEVDRIIDIAKIEPWEHSFSGDEDENNLERYSIGDITLKEYLMQQLSMTNLGTQDRMIARYLIELLDERGYVNADLREIASSFDTTEDHIEEVLGVVQGFEPAGVAARSLAECLAIQLKAMGKYSIAYESLITTHIEDVAANRLPAIAKDLKLTLKEVQEMSDCIRTLEPKPGRQFASRSETGYIIPDIFLEITDGELSITLNQTHVPQLRISSYYEKLLQRSKNDDELAKYLKSKMESALWLLRSIEQRNNTVASVAKAIVEHQKGFFLNGEGYMKPLTLKKIAEETGVHESTVSRTVNGKYLQTGRGIYELRSFFKTGLPSSSDGEAVASDNVRSRIREIIAGEDSVSPFSDQYIAELLNGEGIGISRRTVAKYRDELGILSSSKRKRF